MPTRGRLMHTFFTRDAHKQYVNLFEVIAIDPIAEGMQCHVLLKGGGSIVVNEPSDVVREAITDYEKQVLGWPKAVQLEAAIGELARKSAVSAIGQKDSLKY
jgi:hypothetical protein